MPETEFTLDDYRNAPSNIGPLAFTWADKPHRLIYDLIAWVKRLTPLCPDPAVNTVPVLQEEELIINGELVTVMPIKREPLTDRRLLMTYNQGAELIDPTHEDPEWWKTALAPFQRVYSIGQNPEESIIALGRKVGWGDVHGFDPQSTEDAGGWYYRFWSGDGTSMKAGGRFVPGGVILDWWK